MNRVMNRVGIGLGALLLAGCTMNWGGTKSDEFTYQNYPVASGSAQAGNGHSVTFKGTPLSLEGQGIAVGEPLREAKVSRGDLSQVSLSENKGKVRIISLVPSLDTKVCEQQTHYLSEKNRGLDQHVELVTISMDTPFAQSRFAKEAKIRNVTFLSDYRDAGFGKAHGLLVKDLHLEARTILVVDQNNVVRYMQITPELAQMPDMDKAFQAARDLSGG